VDVHEGTPSPDSIYDEEAEDKSADGFDGAINSSHEKARRSGRKRRRWKGGTNPVAKREF
jgi:hypothetical protein